MRPQQKQSATTKFTFQYCIQDNGRTVDCKVVGVAEVIACYHQIMIFDLVMFEFSKNEAHYHGT